MLSETAASALNAWADAREQLPAPSDHLLDHVMGGQISVKKPEAKAKLKRIAAPKTMRNIPVATRLLVSIDHFRRCTSMTWGTCHSTDRMSREPTCGCCYPPPSDHVGGALCDNCGHSSRSNQLPSFRRIPSANSGTSSRIWSWLGDVTSCFKSPRSKAATSGGRRSTTISRAKYWWIASRPCSTWRNAGIAPAPVETRRSATGLATGQFPSATQATRSSRNGAIAGKPAASSCVTASRSNLSSGNRILFPLRKVSRSCTS